MHVLLQDELLSAKRRRHEFVHGEVPVAIIETPVCVFDRDRADVSVRSKLHVTRARHTAIEDFAESAAELVIEIRGLGVVTVEFFDVKQHSAVIRLLERVRHGIAKRF